MLETAALIGLVWPPAPACCSHSALSVRILVPPVFSALLPPHLRLEDLDEMIEWNEAKEDDDD